jgi:hypothetical protein
MAEYRVLYWQDIPAQVKATDDNGGVSVELDPKFMLLIDKVAMERGLFGTDEYLEGWQWNEAQQRDGTAQEVAKAVKAELEAEHED